MSTAWSLEELAEESQRYLEDEGDSKRVQWKPNGRQIRYYSTLGLLDKPQTENGRTVWYGPRHLLQLLAIKKLQQEGLKLADIQRALAGASADAMRDLVGLPESFLSDLHKGDRQKANARRQTAFWAERPAAKRTQAPLLNPAWQWDIEAGVTVVMHGGHVAALSDQEREELARAFEHAWRQQQEKKTKENP